MLELKDLQERCGLSEHQVRRLVRALAPVLQGRVKRGKDNRLLLDTSALAIMERAVALWRDGLPLHDLSQTLAKEMSGTPEGLAPDPARPSSDHCPACQAREELIRELLADLHARIPALPTPSDSRRSWWERVWSKR